MTGQLLPLFLIYAQLSLLAVGGINSVLPDMHRLVVDQRGWMGDADFVALFALAQAAPGPNMLVSTVVGWRVAGLPGALVATAGMVGPSSLLTYVTAGVWHHFRTATWRRAIQAGLVPVTVGLVVASALILVESSTTGWVTAAITGVTAAGVLGTRLHPLAFLAAGATLGALLA